MTTDMETTTVEAMANERQCLYCGKLLSKNRGRQRKYCSEAHRKAYSRRSVVEVRFCPICGSEVKGKDGKPPRSDAIYDKDSCRQEAFRRQQRKKQPK